MDSPQLVSVVITTYNRSEALLAVLSGLSRQTDKNFEVIVADDGSQVPHRQAALGSPLMVALRATHVWHPDVGFTASMVRNRGVAASKGAYIVFLDGDCVPDIDFIARHKALAKPGCFVNGSRVVLSERLSQRVVAGTERVDGRSSGFWLRQRVLGRANKLSHLVRLHDFSRRSPKVFSLRGLRSCNFGVWRCDFLRVNGFDESFVGWGHEDADFALRLYHAGVARKNGFCATEVFHLWHQEASRSQESLNAQRVAERAKSNITQPTLGYSQTPLTDDVVVTRFG